MSDQHPSIVMIQEFLEKYPLAEYGPAHIILSDYNLEDHWFPSTIQAIKDRLTELTEKLGDRYMFDIEARDLDATLELLNRLLEIPEGERCVLDE